MDVNKLKDGKRVRYQARVHSGVGRIVETYQRRTGLWVIIHDKDRNASVTVRPSQVSAL